MKIRNRNKRIMMLVLTITCFLFFVSMITFLVADEHDFSLFNSAKADFNSIDVNGDGICDRLDFNLVADHYSEKGWSGWIPEDVNSDGIINGLDLSLITVSVEDYCPPQTLGDRGVTYVNVTPATQYVIGSETFTSEIWLDPGEPIIMLQIDLTFDPTLLQCDAVTKGDTGWDFFMAGNIDNVAGEIHGACVAVFGTTVTTPTKCFNIDFTAQGTEGTSTLDLHDILMSNGTGATITPTEVDGTTTIDDTAPVVTINAPVDGAYYQSTAVPAADFDVVEINPYGSPVETGYSTDEGVHTYTVTVTDAAGNVGSDSVTYTVDDTAPIITDINVLTSSPMDTDPSFGWENFTCTVNDVLSGVKEVYLYLDGSPVIMSKTGTTYYYNTTLASGDTNYYITASDIVDNIETTSTDTISKAPNWDINEDGILNGFDVSFLSLNWLVGDGSNPGWIRADINNDGYINGFDVTQISLHWLEMW